MRRREFIAGLASAAAWPIAVRAQQRDRMRSVGILVPAAADDQVFQARVGAFLQELSQLGWAIGRNLRIDMHWAGANAADGRRHAAELAALAPDVILAHGAGTVGTLLEATRRVPIVFAVASDPVAAGLVENLARPGGNATGFMSHEYSVTGKWLELLKQIAPSVTRAAVLRDTRYGGATNHYAVIQAIAPSLRVEVSPGTGQSVRIWSAASVTHQAAGRDECAILEDRAHRVADRQCGELFAPANEECIGADHERTGPQLGQGCKDRIEITFGAGMQDMELQSEGAGRRLYLSRLGRGTGTGRVDEQGHDGSRWDYLGQQLQPLRP
jgi:ABC transporter substrate binding protein